MDYSNLKKLNNKELGNWGEEVAAQFLIEKGYQILARNYRSKQGEIDLIAQDNNYLVFIEVKTRRSSLYGLPQEAIDKRKINKLYIVAKSYLYMHKLSDQSCRFDIVNIILKDTGHEIELIQNALSF